MIRLRRESEKEKKYKDNEQRTQAHKEKMVMTVRQ